MRYIFTLIIAVFILTACSSPQPIATLTPQPTATQIIPTVTPLPTFPEGTDSKFVSWQDENGQWWGGAQAGDKQLSLNGSGEWQLMPDTAPTPIAPVEDFPKSFLELDLPVDQWVNFQVQKDGSVQDVRDGSVVFDSEGKLVVLKYGVFYKRKRAQFINEKVPTLKKPTLKLLTKRGPLYKRKVAHFRPAQKAGDKISIA